MTYIESRQNMIYWLISQGLPVLPIAPAQPAEKYPARNKDGSIKRDKQRNPLPAFTGKNPSWLDPNGKPHLINHRQYQNQLPSAQELESWFANPLNGVGTLGGWNKLYFIDFDVKNFDGSKEACQEAAFKAAGEYLAITGKDAFLQESHSGGWHVGVRVSQKPGFTNFAVTPGDKHVGEALGEGRFCVLAPTIGPSGNPYKIHQWGDPEGMIDSLEQIGIYSSKSPKQQPQKPSTSPIFSVVPGSLPLKELISKGNQEILNGSCPSGDRSQDITALLNDAYGWMNWANDNGISISDSPEEIAYQAGANHGIDSERIERIIKTIDAVACNPAAYYRGEDKSCWKKIYRLDRASFKEKCPAHIKESIRLEWHNKQTGTIREATTGKVITTPLSQKIVSGNFGGSGNGNGGNGNKPGGQEIYKLVENLVNQGLTSAQFQAALLDLSAQTSYALSGLKEIAKEIEAEISQSTGLEDDKKVLEKLLEYQGQDLDLYKVFHESIATPLLTKSNSDRIDPMFMYMNLLPAVAAKLGAHVAIMGKEGSTLADSWIEFAILWMLIVAPPSSGKSQSQSTILKPIIEKQNKARRKFKEDLQKLDKLKADWNSKTQQQREQLKNTLQNPQKFEEQIKPPRFEVIKGGSTPEAIFKRASENPPKAGIHLAYDEISQLMSLDQYKKGVGDSRPKLMGAWNHPLIGEELRSDDKNSILFNNQTLNLSGGIQNAKARVMLSDPDDGDGFLSRFNIGISKLPPNFDIWSDQKVDIHELLESSYEKLDNLPAKLRELAGLPELDEDNNPTTVILKFCAEAQTKWKLNWQEIRRAIKAFEKENPAFSGYLGKTLSQFLRIALGLHCLSVVAGEEKNPLEISLKTFERADYVTRWHIGQYRLLQSRNEKDLSGTLLKIYEYAQRKGKEISAEQIQKTLFRRDERKPKLQEIREYMKRLEAWGKATVIGVGSKLRLIVNKITDVVITKKYDENYDNQQKAENTTVEEVQEIEQQNYDIYDNSSTPEFSEEETTTEVESNVQEEVLSQIDSQEIEDVTSEDCRNCRNPENEEASTPYVELLSDDLDLSENVSETYRNYDNPVEDEDDPDDDPDNDPPGGEREPIAFTSDDEPVFEGSYAVVESEEAPYEWKAQIIWFVARVVSNTHCQKEVLVECESELNIGTKTMPLRWLRLLKKEEIPIYLKLLEEALASAKSMQVAETQAKSLKGKRIKCGEFFGTLASKVTSGWIVCWENSKATLKQLGNPPQYVQEGEFEFIN